MIAALETAAVAVAAAAPFSTSRRLTSILASSHTRRRAMRADLAKGSSEVEHRDPIEHRRAKRIPERTAAEAHPKHENEGRADHRDEESIAARGRKPEDS